MKVCLEKIATLLTWRADYNPRKISDQDLAALRRSLTTFGAVEPVVVNRRSVAQGWEEGSTPCIVGGHQRVAAASLEGLDKLPMTWVDLDAGKERALNLALNRIHGEFDQDKLVEVLDFLAQTPVDLELTGFSSVELDALIASAQGAAGTADPRGGARTAGDRDTDGEGSGGDGLTGRARYTYALVFADDQELDSWYDFLRAIRQEMAGDEVGIGSKVLAWVNRARGRTA